MSISESIKSHPPTTQPFVTSDTNVLLKQYELLVDVHKFYFEISLKFLIFTYAVTGGILSYYLSKPNVGANRFALVFPIAMTAVFSVLAFFSAANIRPITNEIHRVVLLLGLLDYQEPRFLAILLVVTGFLFGLTSFALIVLSFVRASA